MEEILRLLLGPEALVVFVLVILFSGWKGWWVWGHDLRKEEAEKEFWRTQALRGTDLAEKAVTLHRESTYQNGQR